MGIIACAMMPIVFVLPKLRVKLGFCLLVKLVLQRLNFFGFECPFGATVNYAVGVANFIGAEFFSSSYLSSRLTSSTRSLPISRIRSK